MSTYSLVLRKKVIAKIIHNAPKITDTAIKATFRLVSKVTTAVASPSNVCNRMPCSSKSRFSCWKVLMLFSFLKHSFLCYLCNKLLYNTYAFRSSVVKRVLLSIQYILATVTLSYCIPSTVFFSMFCS